jgi:hypothetical protein
VLVLGLATIVVLRNRVVVAVRKIARRIITDVTSIFRRWKLEMRPFCYKYHQKKGKLTFFSFYSRQNGSQASVRALVNALNAAVPRIPDETKLGTSLF